MSLINIKPRITAQRINCQRLSKTRRPPEHSAKRRVIQPLMVTKFERRFMWKKCYMNIGCVWKSTFCMFSDSQNHSVLFYRHHYPRKNKKKLTQASTNWTWTHRCNAPISTTHFKSTCNYLFMWLFVSNDSKTFQSASGVVTYKSH